MAKILVVDDNRSNLALVKSVLLFHKHEVIEAGNGEEGIKMAREEQPDLILMDLQMPLMDGVEAAKIIRGHPATKGIKIICVTAYATQADRALVLEAGFDDYITKPIDRHALNDIVNKNLGG